MNASPNSALTVIPAERVRSDEESLCRIGKCGVTSAHDRKPSLRKMIGLMMLHQSSSGMILEYFFRVG